MQNARGSPLALAGVLLLGMGVIVVRYFIDSPDWVTFQNSPHVYTDGVMNSGKIVDRSGTVVLDATNGKSYADSASLRRSMLHLLGDREGNITPFLLQEYGSELVGFDRLNGTYSTGKREGRMTLSRKRRRAAYGAGRARRAAREPSASIITRRRDPLRRLLPNLRPGRCAGRGGQPRDL